MKVSAINNQFTEFVHNLQNEICASIEAEDGSQKFKEDQWQRTGGGGGKTRILTNGSAIEKAGVNTSVVYGTLPETMQKQLNVKHNQFYATGLSLVIHPYNPMAPTVHANFRYFELYNAKGKVVDGWFGGGTDLTPYYLFKADAKHFHTTLKSACDKHNKELYPKYKKQCDNYFYNAHRQECRGIGGLFFDYLRADNATTIESWMAFTQDVANAFLSAYIPILNKRKSETFTQKQKYWQEVRRGRYVEFNLIHDKGTLFGLKTNGRTASILMSLPPTVRFDYNDQPLPNSPEEKLIAVLKKPLNWVN